MGVYWRGNTITISQPFYEVDPVTGATTPTDPSVVSFVVRDPDSGEVEYVYGVDASVTRRDVGLYLLDLTPPLPPGVYTYGWVGSGIGSDGAEQSGEGTFTVLASGTQPPIFATVAEYGPCQGWIDGEYVAEWDTTIGVGSATYLLDAVAEMASQIMYSLTARQWPGICQRKVRPCRQTCSCFGLSPSLGLGPWYWSGTLGAGPLGWRSECGDSCGCGSESYIELAGYPVGRILEVKLDGVVLDPATEYRLDGRRHIIRLPDLTVTPPVDRAWPVCQDLSLPDTEPGTLSVVYEWGQEPPELGKQAAAQLAVELWRAAPGNQGDCRLPSKVTRIVRSGIEMDRVTPLAELLQQGATGLPLVDTFIAMTNPQGAKMRSLVWSPDVQPRARQVGQDEWGTS